MLSNFRITLHGKQQAILYRLYASNLTQQLTRDRENNRLNKEQGLSQALSDNEVEKRSQDDRNFSPASIDQNISQFNNDNSEFGTPSKDPELDAIRTSTRPQNKE